MYKDNERAEKRAQKKLDRTKEKFEKVVINRVKKDKSLKSKKISRLAQKWEDREDKLSEIRNKPKGEKERELTPDELYERKSMRGLKRAFKKEETGKAEREEKPERNWTTYKEGRELTSDELYLDKKTPRQIARAYFKEGRTEAKAAAAAARAYRKGKMS
jgi:hypothetical protein